MAYISQGGFSAQLGSLTMSEIGSAHISTTECAPSTLSAQTTQRLWPQGMLGAVRTVTNLTLPDAFVNTLSFIASMRQSGALLVVKPPKYICFGIDQGNIRSVLSDETIQRLDKTYVPKAHTAPSLDTHLRLYSQLSSERQAAFSEFCAATTQNALDSFLKPAVATAFWTESGPKRLPATMNIAIDHILLETARRLDEFDRASLHAISTIPLDHQLAFNLEMNLDRPIFKALQGHFGAPPYRFTADGIHSVAQDALDVIRTALNEEALIIQRDEDRTIPPKDRQRWDPNQQTFQLLVSRFNHILRRLCLMSGWGPADLNKQLEIFGQFYGYGKLLEGVSHLKDGAITPTPLIGNALSENASDQFGAAKLTLGNALQDLLFFYLSSAQTLTASDRRALMAITSEITVDSQHGPLNVA